MPDARRGAIAASGAAVLFGSAYVATAFALRSFGPIPAAFWRSALAAVVLVGWLLASRGRGARRPASGAGSTVLARGRVLRLVVLGVFGGLLFLAAMNLAVAGAGATVTAFVAGLYAVLGALFAWPLLGERLSPGATAGLALALVGTALLARLDPAAGATGGIVAGLAGAVSYALFLVLSRRWSAPLGLDPTVISLSNNALAAIGLLAVTAIGGLPGALPAAPRVDALLALVWLAMVALVAQVLVVQAVRQLDAKRSSAFLLLNPLAAVALSAVLLGERLTPEQVLGAALVLVGMALATGTVSALRDVVGAGRARTVGGQTG